MPIIAPVLSSCMSTYYLDFFSQSFIFFIKNFIPPKSMLLH